VPDRFGKSAGEIDLRDFGAALFADARFRLLVAVAVDGAPKATDTAHLAWLRDQLGDRFIAGVLFHTGPRSYRLSERIVAARISTLWG
jgi:hypothetical protein